jgi:hypothetical protein
MLRSKFGTQLDKSHLDPLLEVITEEVFVHFYVTISLVGRPLTI